MNTSTLRRWLDQAWDDHADACSRVALELAERAATLPDDAEGAEAVQLAEHVMLAHLADAPALQAFLAALPAASAAPAARFVSGVARAQWALATLAGEPPPAISDASRWGALHSVVMVLLSRGQLAQARTRLLADEAAAAAHAELNARKAYAATANNTASDLLAGAGANAERDALMIEAAELARRAWAAAGGTWMNAERADYLLALCHAALGHGSEALAAADACLRCCEANGAEPGELFFAHECSLRAQRAAGNGASAAAQREQMVALLAQISDPGLRGYCEKMLART